MSTIFSRIIAGELPGRFVFQDDQCVAILSISPLQPGHTLVIPRIEIDHWLDLPGPVAAHLMEVSQDIGKAQMRAFAPLRVGLVIAGFEVPHCHVHVVPMRGMPDLDFSNAQNDVSEADFEDCARRLRDALDEANS